MKQKGLGLKMFKKIVGIALFIGVLTSVLNASTFYVKAGVGSSNVLSSVSDTSTKYTLGVGDKAHFFGNVLGAVELNAGYAYYTHPNAGIDNYNINFVGHLGYTAFNRLDMYGIAGYDYNTFNYSFNDGSSGSVTGGGLIYGAGADYKVFKYMSVGAEYTTAKYNATTAAGGGTTLTFTNISANIKFLF